MQRQTAKIEAGDLILLSRRCDQMTPLPAAICFGAKASGGSVIDHLGLVVFNPHTQKLCLMEANMNGVTVYPLLDRLTRTSASKIVLRKLHKLSDKAHQATITNSSWDIYRVYANAKYNSSFIDMIDGGLASHASFITNNATIVETYKRKVFELQLINHYLQKNSSESGLLMHYLQPAQKAYQKEVLLLEKQIRNFPSPNKVPTSSVYCSQMIAEILLRHNVLVSNRKPHHFIPADFSSSTVANSLTTSLEYAFSPDYCLKDSSNSPPLQLGEVNGVIYASMVPINELFLHSGDVMSSTDLTLDSSLTFTGEIAIVMGDHSTIIWSSTDAQEVDFTALIQQLHSTNKQFYLLARSPVHIKFTNTSQADKKFPTIYDLQQLEVDTMINLAYKQEVEREYQQISLQHLHSNKAGKLIYSLQPDFHSQLLSSVSQKALNEIFQQPLDNCFSESIETWRHYLQESRQEYFRVLCYSEYAHHAKDQRLLDRVLADSRRRLQGILSHSNQQYDRRNTGSMTENWIMPIAILCGAIKVSRRFARF